MPIETAAPPPATGRAVTHAIHNAARTTGTSFAYLLATAKVESGLDPKQAAATSSARGLFQFVDQTWLMMLKEAGPALGYGNYARAIVASPSGGYEVADPAHRQAVMALRDDPAANAALAGAFTRRNASQLEAALGRAPTEGELYIAHFLGAAGATRLITLAGSNPRASAASAFPNAANANRAIFFDGAGQARTLAEVYHAIVGRYDRARTSVAATGQPAGPQPFAGAPFAAVPPQRPEQGAGAAPMFHGLFQNEPDRRGVSRFITELWSTRPHVAAALSGAGLAATEQSTAAPTGRRR